MQLAQAVNNVRPREIIFEDSAVGDGDANGEVERPCDEDAGRIAGHCDGLARILRSFVQSEVFRVTQILHTVVNECCQHRLC